MRLAFLLAILLASCFYTYVAFTDFSFLSRTGRLGPGFFPRLIGIGLIGFCLSASCPTPGGCGTTTSPRPTGRP